MWLARTGPTKSGTGCCGSPNDSVINGLPGLYGAKSSVSRANGERSLSRAPAPCGARGEAGISILLIRQHGWAADRGLRRGGNGSNHHRYGEVKTRLTIDASADFAQGGMAGRGREPRAGNAGAKATR